MTARAVAFEGLPGAGKTTLIDAVRLSLPGVVVVPELVLVADAGTSRAFFVRNDLEKSRVAGAARRALLDRAWPSTVAYVLAEERCDGLASRPAEVLARLFGSAPTLPTAFVLLDPVRAETRAYASDYRFGDLRFRQELRRAYREVLALVDAPLLVVDDRPSDELAPFLFRHLGLPSREAPGQPPLAFPCS